MIWISWRRSLGRWMRARAEAEALRADVFRVILQAGDAGAKLPAALACFRDAHLDWQLGYYKKRGGQHRQATGSATPYKMLAYLLTGASILLALIGLAELRGGGRLLDPLRVELAAMAGDPGGGALAAGPWHNGLEPAGVRERAFLHGPGRPQRFLLRARRRRARSPGCKRLGEDGRRGARGKAGDVIGFCERVQSVLSAEHLAWIFARPRDAVIVAPPE